jgi:hypothetical protein
MLNFPEGFLKRENCHYYAEQMRDIFVTTEAGHEIVADFCKIIVRKLSRKAYGFRESGHLGRYLR